MHTLMMIQLSDHIIEQFIESMKRERCPLGCQVSPGWGIPGAVYLIASFYSKKRRWKNLIGLDWRVMVANGQFRNLQYWRTFHPMMPIADVLDVHLSASQKD